MTAVASIFDFRLNFNNFWYFLQYFLPFFESTGLSVQENKFKIDFQDGRHGGQLLFPTGMMLSIFNLQVTP